MGSASEVCSGRIGNLQWRLMDTMCIFKEQLRGSPWQNYVFWRRHEQSYLGFRSFTSSALEMCASVITSGS